MKINRTIERSLLEVFGINSLEIKMNDPHNTEMKKSSMEYMLVLDDICKEFKKTACMILLRNLVDISTSASLFARIMKNSSGINGTIILILLAMRKLIAIQTILATFHFFEQSFEINNIIVPKIKPELIELYISLVEEYKNNIKKVDISTFRNAMIFHIIFLDTKDKREVKKIDKNEILIKISKIMYSNKKNNNPVIAPMYPIQIGIISLNSIFFNGTNIKPRTNPKLIAKKKLYKTPRAGANNSNMNNE